MHSAQQRAWPTLSVRSVPRRSTQCTTTQASRVRCAPEAHSVECDSGDLHALCPAGAHGVHRLRRAVHAVPRRRTNALRRMVFVTQFKPCCWIARSIFGEWGL